jgi:RimJ/RimL family protein N-acetyltransferase
MNRDKIFAIVRPAHAASIRVLEKCNMKLLETLNDVPNEEESLVYIIER